MRVGFIGLGTMGVKAGVEPLALWEAVQQGALGREVEVPMPMAELALDELTALERGWGERDSRAAMLLQEERAGVHIAVDKDRIRAALARAKSERGSR